VLIRAVAPQRLTPAFVQSSDSLEIHRADPRYGRVLKPNLVASHIFGTRVETNSLGLRDYEVGPKRKGEFRILSLGDSYAFGFGVELEQAYAKVLARELSRTFPTRTFTVINAGIVGYGTEQMRMSFERLRALQPDFVLATFAASNDVYDNSVFEKQLRTGLQTPLGFLGLHSHAVRLLARATFPLWFFWKNRDRDNIARTIELLHRLESTFHTSQVPYLMLVIPARHQIRPRVQRAAQLLVVLGLEALVLRQNLGVIRHFQEEGVPFIDLLPPLAAKDAESSVSFQDDSHLNALGHEVVACAVLTRLRATLSDGLPMQSASTPVADR
jgi:hypothetical protein